MEADAGDRVRKPVKLTPAEKGVMVHFRELAERDAVAEDALRHVCLEGRIVSQSDVLDSRRRLLAAALKGLIGKGVLSYHGGFYRLPPDSGEEFTDDMVAPEDWTRPAPRLGAQRNLPESFRATSLQEPQGIGIAPLGAFRRSGP